MSSLFKHYGLYLTVFFTGAAVLVLEILATRLLAPYFGNSIYSTSSVITVILTALSLGYWIGGRYSDKHCDTDHFAWVIGASGIGVLVIAFLNLILVPLVGYRLSLVTGPLILSFFLFFGPTILLGVISPYAISLQNRLNPNIGVGTVAGGIFFWSTLGSISGSLLTAFFLIPTFVLSHILLATGLFLVALGVLIRLGAGTSFKKTLPMLFTAIALLYATNINPMTFPAKYFSQGLYSQIMIFDAPYEGKQTRFLIQDRQHSGALNIETGQSSFDYANYYVLHRLFHKEVQQALVIGGGAYLIPKMLHHDLPDAQIDVSEIEPGLESLAHDYFDLAKTPKIKTYLIDGRRFLLESSKRYDLIFSDAFSSLYGQPTQMVSQEFFELVKHRLSENGVFVANVIGYLSKDNQPSLLGSAYLTMKSVFPKHLLVAIKSADSSAVQNFLFFGLNGEMPPIDYFSLRHHPNPIFNTLGSKVVPINAFNLENEILFTDEYAPVETLSAKALSAAASQ